jgi:signal transduction histidine kinase/CheY-like chemotaxis protein
MAHAAVQTSKTRAAGARILIVDDERAVRVALTRTLAHYGYIPIATETAALALRLFDEHEFDLVILDLNMPGRDGICVLEEIKARSSRTEAVMLSGSGSIESAMRSVRAGAFDFIEKPYHVGRLIHTVERALEHQRLRQTTALYQASQIIFATRDFARLPEAVVKVSMQVMAADYVSLLLPGMDGTLYVAHAFGTAPGVEQSTRISMGEGIAGRAALSKTPLVIHGEALRQAENDGDRGVRFKSSIVYPLVVSDVVHGVLTFNRSGDRGPFRTADLEVVGVLASQLLLALENSRLAHQNATTEKLAAVGQLAAGIAHEINTPIQFVGDSLQFLEETFSDLMEVVAGYDRVAHAVLDADIPEPTRTLLRRVQAEAKEMDLAYLGEAVPGAFARTVDGVSRVAEIVRSVKEFGRPDCRENVTTDLNQCLLSTLVVCRSEYKYVADLVTDLAKLPPIFCHPGELNQVFLNLIVNASHAIADVVSGTDRRGKIVIRSRFDGTQAMVSIEDTGGGIPLQIQSRIFEPFFTTKGVGRGTGLGLSLARTIVEKHGGLLTFETEIGHGTRFSMRLPLDHDKSRTVGTSALCPA